jgi:hypothetical protein
MFAGKARAYLSEAPFSCSTLGLARGLIHKYLTRLEKLASDKYSSLLLKVITYGRKKVLYHWHQVHSHLQVSML